MSRVLTLEKVGGTSLILGSFLLAAYSALFPVLLPVGSGSLDYVQMVLNPNWTRLAVIAFAGVILMLVGFYAVYSRIRSVAGLVGAVGFLFIEAAYLLQACKVTWELFLYPVIPSRIGFPFARSSHQARSGSGRFSLDGFNHHIAGYHPVLLHAVSFQ
jgi:hypothetical protein